MIISIKLKIFFCFCFKKHRYFIKNLSILPKLLAKLISTQVLNIRIILSLDYESIYNLVKNYLLNEIWNF